MWPRLEALGISAHHVPAGRFRDLTVTVQAIRDLRALIRRERIDVLLTNSGHPLLLARPAALGTGRPCVWWVHAYVPRNGLGGEPIAVGDVFSGMDRAGALVGGFLLTLLCTGIASVFLIIPGLIVGGLLTLTIPLIAACESFVFSEAVEAVMGNPTPTVIPGVNAPKLTHPTG